MNSKILLSSIVHKRFKPFKHKLQYHIPSLYLNIDDISKINKKYTFFSFNNFNLFSFHERDHGYRDKRSVKKIHKTFIDIFEQNIKKGIIFNNSKIFKDFLSIDKFCQIIRGIIQKNLTGTYNVSIGQKVYLNDLISWLNKFNKEKTIQQKNPSKNQSFFLNNKKLMSKINVKNSLEELKKYCYKYSKKRFS